MTKVAVWSRSSSLENWKISKKTSSDINYYMLFSTSSAVIEIFDNWGFGLEFDILVFLFLALQKMRLFLPLAELMIV